MAKSAVITAHSLNDLKTSPVIIAKVLQHLREPAYFETALALYRRLQYGRFFDSSLLFTNLDLVSDSSKPIEKLDEPWFYAFVDRGCRPETQVWLFGSWEVEEQDSHAASSNDNDSNNQPSSNDISTNNTSNYSQIRSLLLSLIRSIKSLPTPPSIHSPSSVLTAQTQILTSNPPSPNTNTTTPPPKLANPSITLLGAIHSTTTAHLNALDVLATHLMPVLPNHTFIFPLSKLPPPQPLPETLRWGRLDGQHWPLVRSRTEIARQDLTLSSLQNMAIFPLSPAEAAPIAWAFIGLDGSLTSLHVEESHRRLGLAKALTTKIFREGRGVFWGGEEDAGERERLSIAHGNVAVGNEKSAGMCRSLGGVDLGEVFWLKVDLDDVRGC